MNRRHTAYALFAILVVAANLRPQITAIGPVVDQIGAELGLSPAALGLVVAVPLLAFGLVSPLVHLASRRLTPDQLMVSSAALLVAATVVRSLPFGQSALWLGTVGIGVFVAVGNVIAPVVIRRDFPADVPRVTGWYSCVVALTAALGSGVALPVAGVTGWRVSIASWALLSLAVVLVWLPRLRAGQAESSAAEVPVVEPSAGRSVWKSATAWQVTALMATQGATFFMLATWLPSIETARGVSPVTAGWESFGYQMMGIVGAFVVPIFMRGRADHRAVGVVVSLFVVVGIGVLWLVPSWVPVWLLLAGFSGGGGLVLALALVGERARGSAQVTQLSGMVQSVGYLFAMLGPFGAGALYQLTAGWTVPLLALIAVNLVQLVVCVYAGRDRLVGDEPLRRSSAGR